ncbi:hypothetical protein BIW22_20665 [Salmonella enterica]|nr:hypothetical protein [Salmonella enterica]EFO7976564.1 hypothetical protein [Salmonella enterica]
MLNVEQVKHFQSLVEKASKIVGGKRLHIRVSGRQIADKTWCVGLIFGTKGVSDWLKIADVPEADLTETKRVYRAMLNDLLITK